MQRIELPASIWKQSRDATRFNQARMDTRYLIVKEVLKRELGEERTRILKEGVGARIDESGSGRARVAVEYGVLRAYNKGDSFSMGFMRSLYLSLGKAREFESVISGDLIDDPSSFFKAAEAVPRSVLSFMIGEEIVMQAAEYHFVRGSVWPNDLVVIAKNLEMGLYTAMADEGVFERGSDFKTHGSLFVLACVVSASLLMLRSDIDQADPTFVGWDGFMLVKMSGKDLLEAWNTFRDKGWTTLRHDHLPGEPHFVLCKHYYEIFTRDEFGLDKLSATSNAAYKCVFSYGCTYARSPLYSAMEWGVSPHALKLNLTLLGSWMKGDGEDEKVMSDVYNSRAIQVEGEIEDDLNKGIPTLMSDFISTNVSGEHIPDCPSPFGDRVASFF